jgi:hypothetical protein
MTTGKTDLLTQLGDLNEHQLRRGLAARQRLT